MSNVPLNIVVVDDSLAEDDALLVELSIRFGYKNVLLKNTAEDGLNYILENLDKKLIVLLDVDLGSKERDGIKILMDLRKKTTLVYVIIFTAKELNSLTSTQLSILINNDGVAYVKNTSDVKDVIKIIEGANHRLDSRIDCAIEQWIMRYKGNKNQPYITSKSGKSYSLRDVLNEVRLQTDFGKELERGMIKIALYFLTNNEERIDD